MGNDFTNAFISVIERKLNCKVLNIEAVGQGAVGKVYKADIDREPYVLAIKTAKNAELMDHEVRNIDFISSKADILLPKIYFTHSADDNCPLNIIAMQYFDGESAESGYFARMPKKNKREFCLQAVENLEKLQKITNDKYGKIDNAVYDDWNDYYKEFAQKVVEYAENEVKNGRFMPKVTAVMRKAFDNYGKIFDEPVGKPTLIHGDYWTPNMIADRKSMRLIGIVDPFNVMWADKEYELFAVIVGRGRKYGLYDLYKSRNATTRKCDLKIEFYALFSEVYWSSVTGHYYKGFMNFKAKSLSKQMKKFNI